MSVKIKFTDGEEIEEADAVNFGYAIGKYGDMTVVLVNQVDGPMVSVHNNVRSAWVVPSEPTTAFDISSIPKKAR